MKIKTITCHDVYNVGASLQAYALAVYLRQLGHDVEIINYKPDYLSNHYSLWGIGNPKYDKPFLREAYQIAKFPGRLRARFGKRKKEYDCFTRELLPITEMRYASNEELKRNPPVADVYFAGSDQIWNSFFRNGKDPAFYLDFAPSTSIKASYAASFAAEQVAPGWDNQVKDWISGLDFIAVRESSGVKIIENLGIHNAIWVVDPVFLLSESYWGKIEKNLYLPEKYLLLYDFDQTPEIKAYTRTIANKNGWKIYSILSCTYCDRCFEQEGPQAFITLVHNAQFVISNSFHATAFSLIFHKQFVVFEREEKINTRMRDLMQFAGIKKRLLPNPEELEIEPIDYMQVDEKLERAIKRSKEYISSVLEGAK